MYYKSRGRKGLREGFVTGKTTKGMNNLHSLHRC